MAERKIKGGMLPAGMVPSGEMSSYTPTARERVTDYLRGLLFSDDRAGQAKAERLMNVADTTGATLPLDVYEGTRAGAEGRPVESGLRLGMALLPGRMEGMGLLGETAKDGIKAYHSSPYSFDKFQWNDAIRGSGEGAQMIIDGMYLAQAPEVSGKYGQYYKQFMPRMVKTPEGTLRATLGREEVGGDPAAAEKFLSDRIAEMQVEPVGPLAQSVIKHYNEALGMLKSKTPMRDVLEPYTYEVNINARPDQLLNWDEALRYQSPAVQDALHSMVKETNAFANTPYSRESLEAMPFGDMHGSEPIRFVQKAVGKPRTAEMLRDRGIPGVMYLDGVSRPRGMLAEVPDAKGNIVAIGASSRGHIVDQLERHMGLSREAAEAVPVTRNPRATNNFAIRDVDKLEILKRYAIPGALGLGMLKAATDQNREMQ